MAYQSDVGQMVVKAWLLLGRGLVLQVGHRGRGVGGQHGELLLLEWLKHSEVVSIIVGMAETQCGRVNNCWNG